MKATDLDALLAPAKAELGRLLVKRVRYQAKGANVNALEAQIKRTTDRYATWFVAQVGGPHKVKADAWDRMARELADMVDRPAAAPALKRFLIDHPPPTSGDPGTATEAEVASLVTAGG